MKGAMTLTLPALAFLTLGCDEFNALSVRPDPLPQSVSESCPRALDVIGPFGTTGRDEANIIRLGLALNECAEEKDLAVSAYAAVSSALLGEPAPR